MKLFLAARIILGVAVIVSVVRHLNSLCLDEGSHKLLVFFRTECNFILAFLVGDFPLADVNVDCHPRPLRGLFHYTYESIS